MAAPNTVTVRYGIGKITGAFIRPDRYSGVGAQARLHTTWYVHDRFLFSAVVGEYDTEREAAQRAFELNADERHWEKSA